MKQKYMRKGIYSIEAVLSEARKYWDTPEDERVVKVNFDGDLINIKSKRYRLFLQSITCVKCGLTGQYFAKESNDFYKKKPTYHFNLYAINEKGEEVLMTKDHIIPKSRGGKNSIHNFQTMCYPCNKEKGSQIE